jgi:GTP-binding protein EngB required for normal cell division
VTGVVGRVRDALRGDRVDADALVARVAAVQRFLTAVDGHLPPERLVPAYTLVERAGSRLALSGDHTVVALAGTTGSGKSSLFNSLARVAFSEVGVRRPTTGVAHACVWGPLEGAAGLLDRAGVLPRHRFVRESALDGDDEASLRGLVLLDLPDLDSVQRTHRLEVERLVGLVDLVVWVLDPQKYADRSVHDGFLRGLGHLREVTVVALNQADRLTPAEVPRVVADLRRLLDADGLPGVPVLPTSALDQAGIAELRATLERTVAERQAALRRLAGDVGAVTDHLDRLVDRTATAADVDPASVRALTDALAGAAGVPAVGDATAAAYRHRARGVTGWPPLRGLRRLRPDPLRRLHLDRAPATTDRGTPAPVPATSVPEADAARRSAVGLSVRAVAERAAGRLPEPWPAAAVTAARSRLADLPDTLDRAVAGTDLGVDRPPVWWRLVGAVQWLLAVAAVLGLLGLAVNYLLGALGLPPFDYPRVGVVPVPTLLLFGGLAVGLLLSMLVRPLVAVGARRARRRAVDRMREAVDRVGRDLVVAPVCEVLRRHGQAREALLSATTTRH